jgi:sulfur transfer complex TusBCD TusB component (DsrH family)
VRKVLYLLTKNPPQDVQNLLAQNSSPDLVTSAILLHDTVSFHRIPTGHVYALAEDAASRNVVPSVPTVSYQEMLHMIFDADSVVTL